MKNNQTEELYDVGDVITRPKLADTLETIAREGADAFYNGSLSQSIVDEINARGGNMKLQDLIDFDLDVREAIQIELNNSFVAFTTHAPSSGPILAFILNILQGTSEEQINRIDWHIFSDSGYNFQPDTLNRTNTAGLFYHRLIEAFKYAYAKRSELGDPRKINITQVNLFFFINICFCVEK